MIDIYDWPCPKRLASIERWMPLVTMRRPDMDDLAACARHAFSAPMALISVLKPEGLSVFAPSGLPKRLVEPRHAFCRRVVERRAVHVVMNAAADDEYAENPFVRNTPYKRFYAGAPILLPDGHVLGAFCVVDLEPRFKFDSDDEAALLRFARLTERFAFEDAGGAA